MTGDDAGTVWSGIDQVLETGSNEFEDECYHVCFSQTEISIDLRF